MTAFAIVVLGRSLVLLAAVWLAASVLHRRSAALRASVWTAAFVGLVALPVFSRVTPAWTLPLLPGRDVSAETVLTPSAVEPESTTAGAARIQNARPAGDVERPVTSSAASVASFDGHATASPRESAARRPVFPASALAAAMSLVWAVVATILLARLVAAHLRTARVLRHASKDAEDSAAWMRLIDDTRAHLRLSRRVGVCATDAVAVPAIVGLRRPMLLVPMDSAEWTDDARRAVALHELAHVSRWDVVGHLAGQIACALYWFVPAVWFGARRAAALREQATDDVVLKAGVRPSTYAASLIDLARRCAVGDAMAASLAMASPDHVHRRVTAILNASADRKANSLGGAVAVYVLAAGVVGVLAATAPVPRASARAQAIPAVPGAPPAAPALPALPALPAPAAAPAPPEQRAVPATSPAPAPPAPPAAMAPPAPPAPPSPTGSALCGTDTSSSSNSTDENDTRRTWTVRVTGRNCEIDLRVEGRVDFNAAFTDIASLSSGGSFRLNVLRDGVRHELTITEHGGSLARTWRVDGKERPYDAEGQRWLAAFLIDLDRQTAIGVDTRLPALLRQGGVPAVLKETALMPSDYPRSVYYAKLSKTTTLTPSEIAAILGQAVSLGTGDYYAAQLLRSLASQRTTDAEVHAAALRLLASIRSDYYVVEGVDAIIKPDRPSADDVEFIISVVPRLKSDYYKTALVEHIVSGGALGPREREALARVVTDMREDYYIGLVIQRLAQGGGLDGPARRAVLDATSRIRSDYYRVEAIMALVHDPQAREADLLDLVDAVRGVSSDYYKAEALEAIVRHPAATSRVNQAAFDAADRLSTYYRDSVRRAARDR
jgi:beta-lactamase regulating signal transducer with metallopeptidase domain